MGGGDIWLVYFSGNPVKAYENLFTAQQTALKFVCLKHSVQFTVEGWNAFVSRDGPLWTAIRANPHLPLYMLRDISGPPAI